MSISIENIQLFTNNLRWLVKINSDEVTKSKTESVLS